MLQIKEQIQILNGKFFFIIISNGHEKISQF